MHQGLDLIARPAGEEHYPVEAAWSSVWPVRPDWGTGEPPRGPGTVVAGNLTEELESQSQAEKQWVAPIFGDSV